VDEDILRFEVTVDDREGVGVVETVYDLLEDGQSLGGMESSAINEKVE
jgi:hypothetical protein